jgi:phosphoribosylformylglycinamidine synthase
VLADVPAASLSDDAPLYDRPRHAPAFRAAAPPAPPTDCAGDLVALLCSPGWVYRQYDHQLFLNTVAGPGADAALLRLAGPGLPRSERGVALTTDSNPRACALDPRRGTALALAEGVANLACVGATPVAVINCLNFGNPEHPEVMWQLSECIDGMADSCNALSLPIIGGNVSFYNESGGADIDPTPVLGVLGLVDAVHAPPPGLAWSDGDTVVLLGPRAAADGSFPLEGTRWATQRRGHRTGGVPAVDFAGHATVCAFVAEVVAQQVAGAPTHGGTDALVHAVHDVSGGGLAVALAEMAAAAGSGCTAAVDHAAELFTELPSRFVVATGDPDELIRRATAQGIPAAALGPVGGARLTLGDLVDLPVEALREAHEGNLALALGEP